ncbi:MAG: Ras-related protein Rab-13 [Hyperionvirus sp.]|uniref:Ras-related protein Rab-13 n=1 Tax=Hyperionvirus sp. TaxID=2487770 RepID=A0A3G5AE51_9VIRU|nr:MAG: Ras-related protein Rab-13 [Hyperionvirus sp.]
MADIRVVPVAAVAKKKRVINYLFKVVFLGKPRVGKTSIFKVFRGEDFKEDSMPSVNIDMYTKYMTVDEKKVRIDIYDTCGQERFNALTQNYARGAQGVILVSDFNDLTTLSGAFEMYRDLVDPRDNPSVILAANKVDLIDPLISRSIVFTNSSGDVKRINAKEASARYIVNEESLVKNAKTISAIPLMVSAKNGLHIKTIFNQLVMIMIDRQHELMKMDDIARVREIAIPRIKVKKVTHVENSGCC